MANGKNRVVRMLDWFSCGFAGMFSNLGQLLEQGAWSRAKSLAKFKTSKPSNFATPCPSIPSYLFSPMLPFSLPAQRQQAHSRPTDSTRRSNLTNSKGRGRRRQITGGGMAGAGRWERVGRAAQAGDILFPVQYFNQFNMSENPLGESEYGREQRGGAARPEVSFHYQMAEMKARKMVTLIKFSKLNYLLEEVSDPDARPFLLRTPQGELNEEYEIIGFIVNDSFLSYYREGLREASLTDSSEAEESTGATGAVESRLVSLCGRDVLVWARMNERLFELRRSLFPMLEEFYRYLFGHERVRKSRYDALLGRIKKEILKLDQLMAESGELFSAEASFLSIIIACEMFVACKFVFEERFRKSKATLFTKCEKIARRPEFEEVYGKASFCVKECLPVEFEEEEEPEQQRKLEEAIPIEIVKLVESPQLAPPTDKRNELLYNFFRSTLKGQDSKASYFPYFWLMFDNLLCSLVELHFCPDKEHSFQELEKNLTLLLSGLPRLLKPLDYGFLGVYQHEKDRHHRLQGLLCLASHPLEDLNEELAKHADLRGLKALRVDINSEEERRKVEMLWEYQTEGASFEGVKVAIIRDF